MTVISRSYSIRDFKSSKDKDFGRAITLYSSYIRPSIKTSTNEIAYWLDNYARIHGEKAGDSFYVLGFYFEDELIGYAQFVHIKERRLIIFDYMVIEPQYREYKAFFDFVYFIKQFIKEKELIFDYVVAEVGDTSDSGDFDGESQELVRLFRMAKGGVIDAPYYQPKLGIEKKSTQIPAVLMLFSFVKLKNIPREEYLSILDTIYFDHYCRWYARYPETIEDYTQDATALRLKIARELSKTDLIPINGALHQPVENPPEKKYSEETNNLSFILISSLFVTLLAALMLSIQRIFQIQAEAFAFIFLLSLTCFFAIYATLSKNAMKIFFRLLQTLRIFSRRLK